MDCGELVSSSGPRHARHWTKSTVVSLTTGTGHEVFESLVIPHIERARNEVILATCFWAPSTTRDSVRDALVALSNQAVMENRTKITVRICFSSSSLARNMLLPTPKGGEIYGPTKWKQKLGLPDPEELPGLDLVVTRKFFWPFGIIHSKYVVVDRKLAIFPSCNVSWEPWFEVGVATRGRVVDELMAFHQSFWSSTSSTGPPTSISGSTSGSSSSSSSTTTSIGQGHDGPGDHEHDGDGDDHNESIDSAARTILLPSPHRSTLIPFWCRPSSLLSRKCSCIPIPSSATAASSSCSKTPLLQTTHHLLSTARSSITILTPNLTEPAVLGLLSDALHRGVRVLVWTNRRLMTTEQIVTAGTTTPTCVRRLKKMSHGSRGELMVHYFDDHQREATTTTPSSGDRRDNHSTTPVKLHAKVTIVDDSKLLLGSCNMDAASWRTSQELGVLIQSKTVIERFNKEWNKYGGI